MTNFTPLSAAIGGALIGLAAVMLMLLAGRVAGIAGITAGILGIGSIDRAWRIAFIAGLILAPIAAMLAGYAVPIPQMPASWVVIVASGLLVGFGTRLGSGCTSGHGICGLASLQLPSLVAVLTFLATAFLSANLVRALGGGA